MTDQTPFPPPPPPPPAPAAAEVADSAAPPVTPAEPATATSGGGGRGKKLVIGGIAAAVILGGGYGAYAAYDKLDGGGPQPHDVLPASTQAYLRVDLDPSAGQKIDLFKLIRKVPDLADEAGIKSDKQDIRELVFRDIVASECDSLDYDKDVEPWLGDRLGVGGTIDDKSFLIAIQTKDEDASRAGIKKLFACADEKYGIAYLDGYAIVGPQQSDVDAAVTATKKASLGDKKEFVADFDELGNQGVVSGWADLEAIAKSPDIKELAGPEIESLAKGGTVAAALRTDGPAIEIALLSGATGDQKSTATNLAKLPEDTVAALSIAGIGDQVTTSFDSFVQEFDSAFSGFSDEAPSTSPTLTPDELEELGLPADFNEQFGDVGGGDGPIGAQSFIDQIEQATGLKLPEDLATLFGDNLTLAIGADNLETVPTLSGPDGLSALNIAVALTSDKAAALDLVQRIAQLGSDNGIPLVAKPTDGGAVLATNQDAADAIIDPKGSLGDQKAFTSVIPDGDSSYGGVFVNVGTIIDKLIEAEPPADIRADIESVGKISAFGVSAAKQGDDRTLTRVRLSFKD